MTHSARSLLVWLSLALSACGNEADVVTELDETTQHDSALLVAKRIPSTTIGYLEHLPADYASTTKLYPAMIFLHGLGECGDGSAASLEKLKNYGPTKHIKNGHTMTFTVNGKTDSFIVIAPQLDSAYCGTNASWPSGVLKTIINFVSNPAYYRVDPARLYVTGLSLGGNGAYKSVQDTGLIDKIAAIAPIAGWGSATKACLMSDAHLPIWAFHGDADTVITLSKGRGVITAMNACIPAPDPAPIFTIYAGVGHNSWDRAYTTDHTYHNPNVYEWLLAQTKGASMNVAPRMTDVANASLIAGTSLTVAVTAVDANGTAPQLSASGLPSWASFTDKGGGQGQLVLTPGTGVSGSFAITFRAQDAAGLYATDTATFTVSAQASVTKIVRVDLGSSTLLSSGSYNNLAGQAAARGGAITSLKDTGGQSTNISLNVSGFNDANPDGTTTPSSSLGLEANTTRDSFYGNTASFNGIVAATGVVVLSGLTYGRAYELSFFASRMNVTDNRETTYEIHGETTTTRYLQVANNSSQQAVASGIKPDADGTITILVQKGPANTNSSGFFYLGALTVRWLQ